MSFSKIQSSNEHIFIWTTNFFVKKPKDMKSINKSCNHPVSPRELEIIQLIVHEYSTKEIANLLFIGIETVKSHRKNILRKLKVKNVAGMVRVAITSNLLSFNEEVAMAS
jgi:DNA-binding CsgD family transcriptional regulator